MPLLPRLLVMNVKVVMMDSAVAGSQRWNETLRQFRLRADDAPPIVVEGKLTRMVGLTLEAVGCHAAIGSRCKVVSPSGNEIEAEVVGFAGERLFLMPTGVMSGLSLHARVIPSTSTYQVKVGPGLLGRVLDGAGLPLDGLGSINASHTTPLSGRSINPLERQPIREPLDVGVCAINSLLTIGRGQRMGLFAGSGVGKSVLLGMMTRYTDADVIVVGLIGERGREVKEFIEKNLGAEGLKRSVVVASPADTSPLMRLHGAMLATSIAEYFRDQGKDVLLLMDSLTRFAQAQREIALAIGEPPATKGYPPSVFAKLPQLVERAGNGPKGTGSITAFYTVLVEGDDHNDPVADAVRAIVDGHIVLSRRFAEAGRFPAIDIETSISRVMTEIVDQQHRQWVQKLRRLYSLYEQNADLINVGAYSVGSDEKIDEAIAYHEPINQFIAQDMNQAMSMTESINLLGQLLNINSRKKDEEVI
ncbi:MAG: flagellar protein export ATPase FliI [Gammaproteobacteria bacterium]|nr:MAG: flagellar protein export ATPase FliI [Gammaproteobacteria bacterium]